MHTEDRQPSESPEAEIHRRVVHVLSEAPAYRQLAADMQQRLATESERLVTVAAGNLIASVDFPAFVADLIAGIFQPIVDSTVRQMEAYAELVSQAASSIAQFSCEASDKPAARQRQQLIATMALMGINRIVVTGGRIRTRSVFDRDPDDK